MNTKEILIIPDIHGMVFFRDALSESVHNENGSMIWADFFEHTGHLNWLKDTGMTQIVGHTQLNFHPVRVLDRLFCLDCGESFYIDLDGIIRSWRTGESIMNTDNFVSLEHDSALF